MRVFRAAALLAGFLCAGQAISDLPAREPRSERNLIAPGLQRESVSLVLINVVVTDRTGRRVDDLRPDEFSLEVDGHSVQLESVHVQKSGSPPPGPAAGGTREGSGQQPPAPATIASARRFVFFFDGLNSASGFRGPAVQSVRRFLAKGLPAGDQIMVVGQGKEFRIYQDFTADSMKALAALDAMGSNPQIARAAVLARAQPSWNLQPFQTCLGALKAIISYLSAREGRKELFFFSDGARFDRIGFQGRQQVLDLAREAAAAQVTINSLNTRGLPSLINMGMKSWVPTEELYPEALRAEKEASNTLGVFASVTGGTLIHGVNTFDAPLSRLEDQTRVSYVLAYLPPGRPDGKFHSIRVKVRRDKMRIRTEEGYLWMTGEEVQGRKIQSAYVAPELFHELPLWIEARSYLGADGRPAVELAFAVPDQSLLFLPQAGRIAAHLDVGLTLRSENGTVVDRFSQGIEVRLPLDSSAAPADLTLLARRNVPPGEYDAVAVLRDQGSGQVGALRSRIKIPTLVGERIAMSSLVLSSPESRLRRVDLDPQTRRDPQIVVPAARRAFPRDAEVVGSCLVYHARPGGRSGEVRVTVSGSVRKGRSIVRKLPTSRYAFKATTSQGTIPLQFFIPLADFDPGVYTLEVQALDENATRGIVQNVDFLVR
ncbi:MAG TPA: VWA domain-containing protein [Candidatus Polarisedimenticolia bacterium]|nr:VWA domain-containing protein [Candidatus Polarisedimenticolia bacterium]